MPLTILVADDDLGTRLSIGDYLEMAGYLVVAAENGQEALAIVEAYQPHLMITDINMPQMDGYELVQKVRQKPAFRLLPVIFLTSRTQTQDRIRGYQSGADLYLPKPFELDELGAVVRSLLERSQIIQTQMLQTEWQLRAQLTEASVSPQRTSVATPLALNLTEREQEVLKRLAQGLSNAQIGDWLHLSPRTVEKHVSSLLRKTDTSNRAELVRFAMDHHLVD